MRRRFIDMHCDTLLKEVVSGRLYENPDNMIDIARMAAAGQGAQFFAVFFPPASDDAPEDFPKSDEELFTRARMLILDTVQAHSDTIAMAYNAADIRRNTEQGKSSAVLTIEDGRIVGGEMARLRRLHTEGVRAVGLTWNFPNCFGYPNITPPYTPNTEIMAQGLTDFGKDAIAEMNRLGLLIDVSHLSDGGFFDVAELTERPFVATHSNCRALCDHPRNLTDEMIRALADKGGVSGLNFVPDFVSETDGGTVEALCRHVLHFINIGGEDVLALGTDFDGFEGETEISSPLGMEKLFVALEKKGVLPRVLDKLSHENVLRVLQDAL